MKQTSFHRLRTEAYGIWVPACAGMTEQGRAVCKKRQLIRPYVELRLVLLGEVVFSLDASGALDYPLGSEGAGPDHYTVTAGAPLWWRVCSMPRRSDGVPAGVYRRAGESFQRIEGGVVPCKVSRKLKENWARGLHGR